MVVVVAVGLRNAFAVGPEDEAGLGKKARYLVLGTLC